MLVNGKRVKTVRGQRLKARVNLTGLPKGRVKVLVRGTTANGKTVTDTRHYLTCTKRQTKKRTARRG